jgi:preprotein translocase subunit SecA
MRYKFGAELVPEELADLQPEATIDLLRQKCREIYTQKEIEFPVTVGLARFMAERGDGQAQRYDREGLVKWANQRFDCSLDIAELRNKPRSDIRQLLLECSQHYFANGDLSRKLEEHLDQAYGPGGDDGHRGNGRAVDRPEALHGSNGEGIRDLAQWAERDLHCTLSVDQLLQLDREAAEQRIRTAVDLRYRPEMREMERALVLQILDASWKDHLYAMDHLRSSVGLRGYAQIDPKVEYKREGMRLFNDMWDGVADKVTNLVFRMEQADLGFVRSLWQIGETMHAEAPAASEIGQQQESAISNQQGDRKLEPIRRRGKRVGRNDPCPCGSGKKYKPCCMGSDRG